MSSIAVYPGSFDPITLGHIGVYRRALGLFDELHLLVVHNPSKTPTFGAEQRMELAKKSLIEAGVSLEKLRLGLLEDGLLVNYCKSIGATAIVKGFRTAADIEYELPMAQVNRDIASIETLFVPAEAGLGYVSSSLVKQVAELGGEIDRYVTQSVKTALDERFKS